MQPREHRRPAPRGARRRRGDPHLPRRPVDAPPRAGGARPPPPPGAVDAGGRRSSGGRAFRRSTSTSSTAAPARPTPTGPRRSSASSPSTRARRTSAPTPSRSSRARRSPGTLPAIPTTTSRPSATPSPTGCSAPPGMTWYEISNWARARPRVPAQPRLLAPGRLPRLRLRRPQPPRRPALLATSAPWSATPRAVALGERPVAGEERLSGPRRRLEALELALRTRDGVPADALDGDDPRSPASSSGAATPGAHPARPDARQRGRDCGSGRATKWSRGAPANRCLDKPHGEACTTERGGER